MRATKLLLMALTLLFAGALDARRTIQAQPYCANYSDGTQSCGIPSLAGCEQSVSGVGGYCAPDTSSQLRPNLVESWRAQQRGQQGVMPPPGQGTPQSNPNWMPPPPGQ
jgi:hypothetical protein